MYIYIYMYIYIDKCVYTHVYECIYTQIRVCVCEIMCLYIHVVRKCPSVHLHLLNMQKRS